MKKFTQFSKFRSSTARGEAPYQFGNATSLTASPGVDNVPLRVWSGYSGKDAALFLKLNAGNGSTVGVHDLNLTGKITSIPWTYCTPSQVSDIAVTPFARPRVFAVGSDDGGLRIWNIPSLDASADDALWAANVSKAAPVHGIQFNPVASDLLMASSGKDVQLYDISSSNVQPFFSLSHEDQVFSSSWSLCGKQMLTTSRDTNLRIFDPRHDTTPIFTTKCHAGSSKPSKGVFLADGNVLTTGFSNMRERELALWDQRNISGPVSRTKVDSNVGVLTPLYDPDTQIIYFVGRGDTIIRWMEYSNGSISENNSPLSLPTQASQPPSLTPCLTPYIANQTIVTGTLVPKFALDVMNCEVARLIVLQNDGHCVPVSIKVPRRSYAEFADDLFPLTKSLEPAMQCDEWRNGEDKVCRTVSLNPASRSNMDIKAASNNVAVLEEKSRQLSVNMDPEVPASSSDNQPTSPQAELQTEKPQAVEEIVSKASTPEFTKISPPELVKEPLQESVKHQQQDPARPNTASIRPRVRPPPSDPRPTLRFVNSKVTPLCALPETKQLSQSVSYESDAMSANSRLLAIALSGTGGRIGILKNDVHSSESNLKTKGSRIRDDLMTVIVNGAEISDFKVCSISNSQEFGSTVLVGDESGRCRIYDSSGEVIREWVASNGRISFVLWHWAVDGLVLTGTYEGIGIIRLWDISASEVKELQSLEHPDAISSAEWSFDGYRLATTCRDGRLRVFTLQPASSPIQTFIASCPDRGTRCFWISNDHLGVVGFNRSNARELIVCDVTKSETAVISRADLPVSPSLLTPFFDEDIGILYLQGRGETGILIYEVLEKGTLNYLTRCDTQPGLTQSVYFVAKKYCDISNVEVANAIRLSNTGVIDTISFKIPRAKPQFFQDDLFPPSRDVETASIDASKYIESAPEICVKYESLQPTDMIALSQAPKEQPNAQQRKKSVLQADKAVNDSKEEMMNNLFKLAKLVDEDEETRKLREKEKQVDAEVRDDEWD